MRHLPSAPPRRHLIFAIIGSSALNSSLILAYITFVTTHRRYRSSSSSGATSHLGPAMWTHLVGVLCLPCAAGLAVADLVRQRRKKMDCETGMERDGQEGEQGRGEKDREAETNGREKEVKEPVADATKELA
jgi:hypothetical protein